MTKRTKKAKKILTEFDLKNGEKLRIYVYLWGDIGYAKDLGYFGNIIYKPVLVDKDGSEETVYSGKKGLPTLNEFKNFLENWREKLAYKKDVKRLRDTGRILLELAEDSTYLTERKAHVIYQLLRIAAGGPTFRIKKPSDADNLSLQIVPAIGVTFRGCQSFMPIRPFIMPSRFFDALKILQTYENDIDAIEEDLKEDLRKFAGANGPLINLNTLAEHANEKMREVFKRESRSLK